MFEAPGLLHFRECEIAVILENIIGECRGRHRFHEIHQLKRLFIDSTLDFIITPVFQKILVGIIPQIAV